jgi:segregation and condensation protein B
MENIKSQIESLLFISAKPMSTKQLAEILEIENKQIEQAGDLLVEEYKNKQSGIQIVKNGQQYQMVSSPENAELIRKLIKDETSGELSRPSLETLTIIAYRGPISKFELDRIRGVNCALILRNLLLRGLIETGAEKEKGELNYTITMDFIRYLGINDLKDLPEYDKLHQDNVIPEIIGQMVAENQTN